MSRIAPGLAALTAAFVAAVFFSAFPITGQFALMPLFYLAPLPLFASGLGWGTRTAVIAGVAACLLTALALGNVRAGLLFLVLYAAPTALVVRHALLSRCNTSQETEWYPPGQTLLWLIGYSLMSLAVLTISTAGSFGGLHAALTTFLESQLLATPALMTSSFGSVPADQLALWIPGMVAVSWLLMMVINGALGQALVKRLGCNLRPSMHIRETELPTWAVLGFSVAALSAVVGTTTVAAVGLGAALSLGFGFFLVGLGVLHAMLRGRPFVLTAVYVSLVLSWPALLVTALGLLDQWVNLRRRLASPL